MSANKFSQINRETLVSGGLAEVALGMAAPQQAHMTVVEASVEPADTITIDGQVFEILDLLTDTTVDTADDEFANTTNPLTGIAIAGLSGAVGDYLLVESEYFRITAVTDTDVYNLSRGHLGSTIASHADGEDILTGNQLTAATNFAIGRAAVGSATVLVDDVVRSYNAANPGPVSATAVRGSATLVSFLWEQDRSGRAVSSDTAGFVFANGAAATTGVELGEAKIAPYSRVPVAAEVTAGNMFFAFPFPVKSATVQVRVTATGAIKVWDGASTALGQVVTITNAGSTDWATTDTVTVIATG